MTPSIEDPTLETSFEDLTDGLRVLLVEDQEDQHYLVQRYFRGSHASLFWARDAREAMDRIGEENFDLLILDVMLPDLDGWELFSKIREMPEHQKTPTLFVTCVIPHSEESLASDEHGFCRTLSKPCSKDAFRQAIVDLLQG